MTNKRKRLSVDCSGKSRTQSHHAKNANINSIVKRFKRTGVATSGMRQSGIEPRFDTFVTGEDYFDSCCRVARAKSDFECLPADVRKGFDNKVENAIDFINTLDLTDLGDDMRNRMRFASQLNLLDDKLYDAYVKKSLKSDKSKLEELSKGIGEEPKIKPTESAEQSST